MTESARQRIHEAVEQLRTPDRVAISCTVLVRPTDLADSYLSDGEVIDRWTVDEHTDEDVKVECVIESYSEHGQKQYTGIQSAIDDCEDLLVRPHGKNATHLLIERLISDSAELNQKMELVLQQGVGHEMTGPHLFFRLPGILKKTARERTPVDDSLETTNCVAAPSFSLFARDRRSNHTTLEDLEVSELTGPDTRRLSGQAARAVFKITWSFCSGIRQEFRQ